MKILLRLWRDTSGATSVVGTLLLYTIVVLGVTVGLVALRDQIAQEFGDLAVALDNLDQSWEAGGAFYDDPGPALDDPIDSEPAGISVQDPPLAEGDFPPFGWTPTSPWP